MKNIHFLRTDSVYYSTTNDTKGRPVPQSPHWGLSSKLERLGVKGVFILLFLLDGKYVKIIFLKILTYI